MTELEQRSDELRAIAKTCKTINDFARATGFSMETASWARETLGLELPDARLKAGPATEAKAVPKPVKRK